MIDEFAYDDGPHFRLVDMQSSMMNMVYEAIMVDIDGAIKADTPTPEKINALQTVLKFFEKSEEYEKCGNIKKIIDSIHVNNSSRQGQY